jgi:putative zinc finger protein
MTLLSCAAVQRRLHAFYDQELPVREQIAIKSHVQDCPPCSRELRDLERVGDMMRLAAAPGPADDWTGVQPGVISRMRAEAHETWTARVRRTFDDMHLVWIGLMATAATFVCAATVLSMLHLTSIDRRQDSLAAVLAVMSAPYGSDLNPIRFDSRIRVPTVPEDGIVFATLESTPFQEDCEVALAARVTREGIVSGLEVLGNAQDEREAMGLLRGLTRARLEPAQFDGAPVAVNLVWLVAHTTVKGKYRS